MNMFDPEFCEKRCPVCTRARKGNRFARAVQWLESLLTLGGCPWGRARTQEIRREAERALAAGREIRGTCHPVC